MNDTVKEIMNDFYDEAQENSDNLPVKIGANWTDFDQADDDNIKIAFDQLVREGKISGYCVRGRQYLSITVTAVK